MSAKPIFYNEAISKGDSSLTEHELSCNNDTAVLNEMEWLVGVLISETCPGIRQRMACSANQKLQVPATLMQPCKIKDLLFVHTAL